MLGACADEQPVNDISPNPLIRSVATDFDGKAVYGMPVVIEGENFNPTLSGNEIQISFGSEVEKVAPLEVSPGRLMFRAPMIKGSSAALRVISGKKESGAFTLEYDVVRSDSVFLKEGARIKTLREGVVWTNIYKVWEEEIRSINLLEIELSDANRLAIACPTKSTRTSDQCLEKGAFLGVNGSYFSSTYVKVDGKVIRGGKDEGVNIFMRDGVFTLDDNVPGITYVGSNSAAAMLPNKNIMTCGPLLMLADKYRTMVDNSHNTTTHPRTGVAITKDGRVLLVTVDGRFVDKAVGMSTSLFTRLLDAFGAEYALNLDGGGSTTMWIEGLGIVNHPCDERQWDNPVERAIGSIIYLK